MDEFTTPKTYLREQTGIVVNVKDVKKDEVKQEVIMVFEKDGALLDGKFSLTGEFAPYAQKQMGKIREMLGITSLKEAVGKQIGVHLNLKDFTYKKGPKTGQKGISCNIAGYFPVVKLKDEQEDTDSIPF